MMQNLQSVNNKKVNQIKKIDILINKLIEIGNRVLLRGNSDVYIRKS